MDHGSTTFWQNLETATRSHSEVESLEEVKVLGLTILAHPDLRRIGERSTLIGLNSGQEVHLSRLEPLFAFPGDARRRPLADPHLSRRPLRLALTASGAVRLSINGSKTRVVAEGISVQDEALFSVDALEEGVVFLLAERLTLILHWLDPVPSHDLPNYGLVGESSAISSVRRQIHRIADVEVPVLLRGETGTGKELVASAVHHASPRSENPFLAVNMGAVPATLASAELFGATRGAFTGADRARPGFFPRADKGTLFLDEIGETSLEVQGMLLRALESGEVQSVGASKPQRVDVRILAATDARLEEDIDAGRFRAPLLHRLSGTTIWIPPLRKRRDDLGRLLMFFLRREFEGMGRPWGVDHRGEAVPRLPAPLVARLALSSWPGNVRQLRNVARQLVVESRGESQLRWSSEIAAQLEVEERPGALAMTPPPLKDEDTKPSDPVPRSDSEESNKTQIKTLLLTEFLTGQLLVENLGDREGMAVLRRHDRQARQLLVEYEGREIDKGEGFLLLFDRPIDALGYALEYHENLASLSLDFGFDLLARVGLHLGEVVLHRNARAEVARGAKILEVEGPAKSVVFELLGLAEGGQTLLTRTAFDLARAAVDQEHPLGDAAVHWLDHGTYRLEGVSMPVELFEVGLEGQAPLRAPAEPNPVTSPVDAALAEPSTPSPPESKAKRRYRSPDEVSEEELLAALRAHAFRIQPTAAALQVSRTSLYALIEKFPSIKKARDLGRQEIEAQLSVAEGDLDRTAAALEVSRKGLRRRMTELGIE